MLKKINKTKSEGFTIIEVIIVLAIAGLILLIVLLAVPALQRSARNTAIKNDSSALAAGISDFESNNNGAVPTKEVNTSGSISIQNATIASGATAKIQGADSINGSTGTVTFPIKTRPVIANVSAGSIYVDTGESCPQNNIVSTSTRAFAVYYWTETPGVVASTTTPDGIINGTGLTGQCIDT